MEIHIAGQNSGNDTLYDYPIKIHAFDTDRRLTIWSSTLKLIKRIKPDLIVACSPDLLLIAVALKSVFNFKLIYDIQENYSLNYHHLYQVPFVYKWFVSKIFELSIYAANQKADVILLAEQVYLSQLKITKPAFVLENKLSLNALKTFDKSTQIEENTVELELVFSGTLSEKHGVFDAIRFVETCNEICKTRLTIIGHMADKNERKKLANQLKNKPFIETYGIDHLVSHHQVLSKIKLAHAGLLFYQNNAAFRGKVPTKFFEYVGLNKWVVALRAHQFNLPSSKAIIELNSSEEESSQVISKLKQIPPESTDIELFFDSKSWVKVVSDLIS